MSAHKEILGMSEVPNLEDEDLFEILTPLFSKRPELRSLVAKSLIEALKREGELGTTPGRRIAFKKNHVKIANSPPFSMFSKVRRLVIMASKPGIKEQEVERQLEEEWLKLGPSEKEKWENLANAGESTVQY